MDNLTHTATGLFLSRAGLGRKIPHASWILMIAANAPDIDVVSLAGGPLAYLNWHRHLTHSLAAMPVMALLAVAIVRLAARKPLPWLRAWGIALVGAASHLALDFTNIYGIRLLLPFSGGWFRGDLTSVVDLWIWGAFLVAVAGPLIGRLVNAEIGAGRRQVAPGRGWAWFALGFLLLYNGGRAALHARAEAMLDARLYQGAAPLRVAALPSAANPWHWRGIVETREFYSLHEFSLLADFDPAEGRILHQPDPVPALEAARRTPVFQDFLRFSQFPLWRVGPVEEPENGARVDVMDLRFGVPPQAGFVASAILDGRLQPVRAWFQFGRAGPR